MKKFALVICILVNIIISHQGHAQYYILGQDPASQKWFYIETEHFKILFPKVFLPRANELAAKLEYMYENGTQTLKHKPKKIPVIIHTEGVVPNAYSLWTPKRTEFFMTPPQNNYAQNWMDQLIIHEDRHMIQMDKMNKGATRVLSFFIGQHAGAMALGLFLPMWYMEGDAIVLETSMSQSGRGRLPSFEMKMRAQILEKGLFNFEKASLGSFIDYVPDQYYFGYYFVAQSRAFYGAELWEKAIDNSGRNPWQISPISHSFRMQTGLNKKQLYKKLYSNLRDQWLLQASTIPIMWSIELPLPKSKHYSNYKYPHFINDSIIIAEKSGLEHYPQFVKINIQSGKEQIITSPGYYTVEELPLPESIPVLGKNSPGSSTADFLSIERNKMVWSEKKLDPRWEHRNYSVIMIYDIEHDRKKQLTHQSRLFAPSLFPDATQIAAVQISNNSECNIVILNALDGKIQKILPNIDSLLFMVPSVSENGKKICCVAQGDSGNAILEYDVFSGRSEVLLEPSFTEISNPTYQDKYIFFNASFSGINNIYALDTATRSVFKISSVPFGAFDADLSPNKSQIVFSYYTSDGFTLHKAPFDSSQWQSINSLADQSIALHESYLAQESGPIELANIVDGNYTAKPYREIMHLFNFHSWLPVSMNMDNYSLSPGLSFMSQNLLTTSVLQCGYAFNANEKNGRIYADYKYTGFYPVFKLNFSEGIRNNFIDWENNSLNSFSWHTKEISFGLSLPFTSTYRQFYQKYFVSSDLCYSEVHSSSPTLVPVPSGRYLSSVSELSFSNYEKTVLLDLAPRFGQSINAFFRKSLSNELDLGEQFAARVTLFFPGLLRHHSFKVEGDFQKKHASDFSYEDHFIYPRGFVNQRSEQAWRISINYKMPLCYPDAHIGSIFYFRRIKMNLFVDYAEGKILNNEKYYRSFGAETTCDTHVLRFFIPLDIGFRYTYIPQNNADIFELLLGINFSGF